MPVVTAYATTVVDNPGSWTDPTNGLGAPDAAVAEVAPARDFQAEVWFKFDPAVIGSIPANAVINSATWTSRVGVDATTQTPQIFAQLYDGSTPLGTGGNLTLQAGIADEVSDVISLLTMDVVLNNDVGVIFGALTTGNKTRIYQLDAMWLTIDYSESVGSQFRGWDGSQWQIGRLNRWNGSAWVPAIVQRWNGSSWEDVP